jgi:hypothetical protein
MALWLASPMDFSLRCGVANRTDWGHGDHIALLT